MPYLTRFILSSASLATLFSMPAFAHEGHESLTARSLAANCASCHGTNGNAKAGMPRLAGLGKDYFVEQMQSFKSGKRQATLMHQIAKGFDDQQIAQLAEYFAAQK
ncbi:MAG: c-type cytochrome [Burkholderiales bacterium]